MVIFLPTADAGRVELGSEARIVLDSADSVIPATVSFVAADAQFTPKYVETADEREKMMYRIKLHVDPQLVESHRGYIKAGMTGNAYVKIRADMPWPRMRRAMSLASRIPCVPDLISAKQFQVELLMQARIVGNKNKDTLLEGPAQDSPAGRR